MAYEWKNVYRAVVAADFEGRGVINMSSFNKIIHQNKVYLSREELRKVETGFGCESGPLGMEIDYVKLSTELGLHKSSLDFIRSKSKNYVDTMTKMRVSFFFRS